MDLWKYYLHIIKGKAEFDTAKKRGLPSTPSKVTPPSKKASADFGDGRVLFDKEGDLKEEDEDEDEDEDGDGQVGKWNLLEYSMFKIFLHSA